MRRSSNFNAAIIALVGMLWGAPGTSTAAIQLDLTGLVTSVNDGGFPAVPPLSDDVSVGNLFTSRLVLDEDAPFSRTDDESFPTPTRIVFEERFFWSSALQSAAFSVGTLSGSGDSGSFSYTFTEISDTAKDPSGLPIEHTDFSQVRENTMNMDFADGGSISNGALVYSLEHTGTPDPYLGCSGSDMRCLLASGVWSSRRVLITAFQRGSALVQITGAVIQPQTLLGDANNDLRVTGADLIAVQQNFGASEPLPATGLLPGDANDDGQVTGGDLITVQQRFGTALASPRVPEPTGTALIWVLGLLAFFARSA